mmetsp:Transcript_12759/g.27631  ORF Transcript_12759/g.27631 Transcript_12759/m.27631 type:complete len:226 (-) Transcript_12759:271-948(-)
MHLCTATQTNAPLACLVKLKSAVNILVEVRVTALDKALVKVRVLVTLRLLVRKALADLAAWPIQQLVLVLRVHLGLRHHPCRHEPHLQVVCLKVVCAPQAIKPHHPLNGHPVLEAHHTGQHLDVELDCEEGGVGCTELYEARLEVLFCKDLQVLIHDFASFKISMEKVANNVFCLGDDFQEFSLRDLRYLAMSLLLHLYSLLPFLLHLGNPICVQLLKLWIVQQF